MRRINTTWALLGAVALLVAPVAARAADPVKETKADPRLSMNREQLRAQTEKSSAEFQRRLEAQKRLPPSLEYLHLDEPSGKKLPARELEVRIEKYLDGAILYSTPLDKSQEPPMRKLGQYRDVSSKDQVSDRTIFEGRVYRVMRASGASGVNWAAEIGKSGTLKLEAQSAGGLAVGFKGKK